MRPLKSDLGDKIRSLRRSLKPKVSQEKYAELVGVDSVATVSRWERGLTVPEMETLERIAKIHKKPVGYFLDQGVSLTANLAQPASVEKLIEAIKEQESELKELRDKAPSIDEWNVIKAMRADDLVELLVLYLVRNDRSFLDLYLERCSQRAKDVPSLAKAVQMIAETLKVQSRPPQP